MSIDPNASGGSDQNPGGKPGGESDDSKNDKSHVSYESHQKLLDEKKAIAKRLAELEKRDKDRETEELKKKEDFKKLLEIRDQENADLKAKLTGLETGIASSRKLRSLLGEINGEVEEQYWQLIDLDQIPLDADGKPDAASVKKAARDFEKRYSAVIKKKDDGKMPNDPANPPPGKLTHAEWVKLPYEEKKKRMHEVM